MGIISPTTPTIGQVRGDGEVAVRNDLIALLNEFNGNIQAANIALGSITADRLTGVDDTPVQHTISRVAGRATGLATGTYHVGNGAGTAGSPVPSGADCYAMPIRIAASELAVSGKTAKLRVEGVLIQNATAPTATFSFCLLPLTAGGGGAGTVTPTFGAPVAGSTTPTSAAPAASSITQLVGSDFTLPADGLYLLGLIIATSAVANSFIYEAGLTAHWT